MDKPVTKTMLRDLLYDVNQKNRSRTINNSKYNNVASSTTSDIYITEKTISKVKNDTVITTDGLEAKLFSPLPCLYWKCMVNPDDKGVCNLSKTINGLFLVDTVMELAYCIGVSGFTDEFELRLQIGTDEIRFNNKFLNISSKHIIKNGLEEEI